MITTYSTPVKTMSIRMGFTASSPTQQRQGAIMWGGPPGTFTNPKCTFAPTVNFQQTSSVTPTITGTLGTTYVGTDVFTVTIADQVYTPGDGSLSLVNGTAWSLKIPAGSPLANGTYDVEASYTRAGQTTVDQTTAEINVQLNIAPVLVPQGTVLSMPEDAGVEGPLSMLSGFLIENYTTGVTDANYAALTGIAIVATTEDHGAWYYSNNSGFDWYSVGPVSMSSALLLGSNLQTLLVFRSDLNYNGLTSSALTFYAWDQTNGTSGDYFDIIEQGGGSAFSVESDSLQMQITAVNDAPAVVDSASLDRIDQQTFDPPGDTVANIFSPGFSDSADDVTDGSSADSFAGIAVCNNTADWLQGEWQYYDGDAWYDIGFRDASNCLVLAPDAWVRFVPEYGWSGTPDVLQAYLIDSSAGMVTTGDVVDLESPIATGGITQYSADLMILSTAINLVVDNNFLHANCYIHAVYYSFGLTLHLHFIHSDENSNHYTLQHRNWYKNVYFVEVSIIHQNAHENEDPHNYTYKIPHAVYNHQ
jgi:hypothetical protein